MIKVLEKAIEKIKRLPEERQALAAEILEQIAAGDAVFEIPGEHRQAILEGLEQARRGELVSEEEMVALWKKCGL
jgi:hypothetical protein